MTSARFQRVEVTAPELDSPSECEKEHTEEVGWSGWVGNDGSVWSKIIKHLDSRVLDVLGIKMKCFFLHGMWMHLWHQTFFEDGFFGAFLGASGRPVECFVTAGTP